MLRMFRITSCEKNATSFEVALFIYARSGSVVECWTRDQRAVGSSLTGVTALWS